MKKETQLPRKAKLFQIMSKASEGQDSMKLRFIKIEDGYDCFFNDVRVRQINSDHLEPLLKKLMEIFDSFSLRQEITISL